MPDLEKTTGSRDALASALAAALSDPFDGEPDPACWTEEADAILVLLGQAGWVIAPGQMFAQFPESPDRVNVREWLEARNGKHA